MSAVRITVPASAAGALVRDGGVINRESEYVDWPDHHSPNRRRARKPGGSMFPFTVEVYLPRWEPMDRKGDNFAGYVRAIDLHHADDCYGGESAVHVFCHPDALPDMWHLIVVTPEEQP